MKEGQDMDALEIFKTFALHGFRKTSMAGLAEAAGMSRQGLYKKFKSKDAVFDWMVGRIVALAMNRVEATIADDGKPLPERLSAVFDSWSGQFIDILRTSPHAAEIVDRITSDAQASHDMSSGLIEMLVRLLLDEQAASHEAQARDCAFTLYVASKGLSLTAENRRAFNEGMRRVINAVLPQR